MFKAQLVDRLAKLRARRADLISQRSAELANIEEQIAFCQGLVDNWDVFTIDEALAALAKTGIRLRLDS